MIDSITLLSEFIRTCKCMLFWSLESLFHSMCSFWLFLFSFIFLPFFSPSFIVCACLIWHIHTSTGNLRTDNSSIFCVPTVMNSNAVVIASIERSFCSVTRYIIQKNGTVTTSESGARSCQVSTTEPQLPACHRCVIDVPWVIAHRPPRTMEIDFHTSFVRRTSVNQSDRGNVTINFWRWTLWRKYKTWSFILLAQSHAESMSDINLS